MTIQETIEKAIEGGYGSDSSWTKKALLNFHTGTGIHLTLLDPLFWQSLGKAMGWPETSVSQGSWLWQWQNFIERRAYGETAELFFQIL